MFAKVLPLNKTLHAGQFVGCEYSIVGCISVYSNDFFSNVNNVLFYFQLA